MNPHPFQLITSLLKQYEIACKENNSIKAYQIAIDISDIALQLEQYAQSLVNED
jgi:hypothetical protein